MATTSPDERDDLAELPDGPAVDGVAEEVLEPDATEADEPTRAPAGEAVEADLASVEALLFSTHHPLTPAKLAEVLELPSGSLVRRAVLQLNEAYAQSGRSFRIEQVAGGYQMLTLPKFGPLLRSLHQKDSDNKLTRAAQETLAVIAYKQPVLRADVEAIRGVACGETIRKLMELRLVKIAGRAEMPGRPILYGTTKRFLETFGLNTLKDLPQPEAGEKRRG